MMDNEKIRQKFQKLNVWKSGDQRAAHKPLLVLYAIGKLLRGESRLISFADIEEDLRNLLREFGPWHPNHRPQYPFWRLRKEKEKILGNTRRAQNKGRKKKKWKIYWRCQNRRSEALRCWWFP